MPTSASWRGLPTGESDYQAVSVWEGGALIDTPAATATVGTHPTGIHSRLELSEDKRNFNIALMNTFCVKILC